MGGVPTVDVVWSLYYFLGLRSLDLFGLYSFDFLGESGSGYGSSL